MNPFAYCIDDLYSGIKQSYKTGDCWLLAGIIALSFSQKGQAILQNAITQTSTETQVYFKGLDKYIILSKEEIKNAQKNTKYSSGSKTMVIWELAIEKLRNDARFSYLNKSDAPDYVKYYYIDAKTIYTRIFKSSIDGGFCGEVFYLLTGIKSEIIDDRKQIINYLNGFRSDNEIACCDFDGPEKRFKMKDFFNKSVGICTNHAYAIKSANKYVISVVNPHNTKKEILLPREMCCINRIEYLNI